MQSTNSGGSDAFVFELNPAGSALLYSFYLGGKGNDVGHGLGLDAGGNAYVIGQTISTDFPVSNALQPTFAGGPKDVFVTKILAQPVLTIARAGPNLVLSWQAPSPEFVLEVNTNGMRPADWTAVSQTPTIVHGMNTVTLNVSGGHQTFRLKRQ
jgi:hypothetical protein